MCASESTYESKQFGIGREGVGGQLRGKVRKIDGGEFAECIAEVLEEQLDLGCAMEGLGVLGLLFGFHGDGVATLVGRTARHTRRAGL